MSDLVARVLCPVRGCDKTRAEMRLDDAGYFIAPVGFDDRTGSAIALKAADYARPLPEDRAALRSLDVWIYWDNETGLAKRDPDTDEWTVGLSCRHNRQDVMGRSTGHVIVDARLIANAMDNGLSGILARFEEFGPNTATS